MSDYSRFYTSETRTAGQNTKTAHTIQAWKKTKSTDTAISSQSNATRDIIASLEKAKDGKIGRFDHAITEANINTINAYAPTSGNNTQPNDENFKFSDIVDILNPLQHIPIVNMAYRGITGDNLHPMAQIIGGALYGGPVGAVTGTANAITKIQTGKDIGDHGLAFMGFGSQRPQSTIALEIEQAVQQLDNGDFDLPPTQAMSFAGKAEINRAVQSYEKVMVAQGRTAGNMIQPVSTTDKIVTEKPPEPTTNLETLPAIEAMTTLSISPMPAIRDI